MKGVTVSTDNTVSIIDIPRNGSPLYEIIHETVGGWYENVHPRRLARKYVMIVNEEGKLLHLPTNAIASYLYETDKHGEPIVGNVIILKMGVYQGEADVIGMSYDEAVAVMTNLTKSFKNFMKSEEYIND